MKHQLNKTQHPFKLHIKIETNDHKQQNIICVLVDLLVNIKLNAYKHLYLNFYVRLSHHISLKLAASNPNIADLSDMNRPTLLVEKFTALYDDEWTNAFDALQQNPVYGSETEIIGQLLQLLMVSGIKRLRIGWQDH